jgi:hypothetical protein
LFSGISRRRDRAGSSREVSRFARNSRDWQQLVEMCRVVDTLLIDQEAVYAPRQGNDRLLLGLKGSLNEYELDLLRQRSLAARYEKARRGERWPRPSASSSGSMAATCWRWMVGWTEVVCAVADAPQSRGRPHPRQASRRGRIP